MRHRRLTLGAMALSTILVLAAVRLLAVPAFVSSPDSVRVVVTEVQLPSAGESVIFDHQFSQQASTMYRRLTANEPIASDEAQSCPSIPNDLPYYHYQLTFFHLGITVATAVSDARGCADIAVTYPDGSMALFFWTTSGHVSFWMVMHQLVNAPEPINTCIGLDAHGYCIQIPAS